MKTTINLPQELLQRARVVATERRTTLKALIIAGLEWAVRNEFSTSHREAALGRLRQGLRLVGHPLTRAEAHGGG